VFAKLPYEDKVDVRHSHPWRFTWRVTVPTYPTVPSPCPQALAVAQERCPGALTELLPFSLLQRRHEVAFADKRQRNNYVPPQKKE
jgi:hypothetical protein